MESATFRKWLADRGCRIDTHEHIGRSHGHPYVTVHREGRTARLPILGAHERLDPRIIQEICESLELDASELPGPKSRV